MENKLKINMKKSETPSSDVAKVTAFVSYLQECTKALKRMHWKTTSYAQHKALDKIVDACLDNTDTIAETASGYLGQHLSGFKDFSTTQYENMEPLQYVKEVKDYIQKERYSVFPKEYTPIQNILDTLVGELDKGLYLLSLK